MTLFDKKAYLILITFDENGIFAVFAENDHFLHFSGTPLVYHCFSLFWSCQVFPWVLEKMTKLYIIFMKNPKITVFGQNVTDRSDNRKTTVFGHKNSGFYQFSSKAPRIG